MTTYYFDDQGGWSGGGSAFLRNAAYASERHRILDRRESSIPIIARNVPARRLSGPYVLAPQNAWPYAPANTARGSELARWLALRAASTYYARRAAAVLRISEAIPPVRHETSPVIHNVLDTGFEDALEDSFHSQSRLQGGGIVSIGSLHGYRNYGGLLNAYRWYREFGGRMTLTLHGVGSSASSKYLRERVAGVDGVELVESQLSRAECLSIYRGAALVVFPALVEASPFSLLEALAVTPRVLCSNILGHAGILASVGRHSEIGELLFQADDPYALGVAMRHAVDRSDAEAPHEKLSDDGFRESERERWATEVAQWLEKVDLERSGGVVGG